MRLVAGERFLLGGVAIGIRGEGLVGIGRVASPEPLRPGFHSLGEAWLGECMPPPLLLGCSRCRLLSNSH